MTKQEYFTIMRDILDHMHNDKSIPDGIPSACEEYLKQVEGGVGSDADVKGFMVGADEQMMLGILDGNTGKVLALSYTTLDAITKAMLHAIGVNHNEPDLSNVFKSRFSRFGTVN